jgi:hypothetical protein
MQPILKRDLRRLSQSDLRLQTNPHCDITIQNSSKLTSLALARPTAQLILFLSRTSLTRSFHSDYVLKRSLLLLHYETVRPICRFSVCARVLQPNDPLPISMDGRMCLSIRSAEMAQAMKQTYAHLPKARADY